MSKQKKQGFTLIELMVVIVIIGILAAIAIPKLFGMTAKAKAQEVGPSASTWIKLQQAFAAETGRLGPNNRIGYTLPGAANSTAIKSETGNFEYETSLEAAGSASDETNDAAAADFTATAKTPLGECKTTTNDGAAWKIAMSDNGGTIVATITPDIPDCVVLTPQFTKLGTPTGGD